MDIWHLFGLISRISGLLYVFFFVSVLFLVSVIVISFFFVFPSQAFHLSHNHLFLEFLFFCSFKFHLKHFYFFLVYVLDKIGSLPATFSVQIIYRIVAYIFDS